MSRRILFQQTLFSAAPRRSLLPKGTLQGPQRQCVRLRQATLALLSIPSAFTKGVLIGFYSRTTCSCLSLKHVCCCRCSRFCPVRWYTCGRGTDVFVDLCHHHLQICVCVISGRGSRRFTGGFVFQLHLHNSSSMEATRDPFQSVSANDDDVELTSRRMRLFPECGRLTCVLPCLCVVGMIFSTVFWLGRLLVLVGGCVGLLPHCNRQHFCHRVHAARVCLPEATSMLAARLAARGSARRTGCDLADRVAALECTCM